MKWYKFFGINIASFGIIMLIVDHAWWDWGIIEQFKVLPYDGIIFLLSWIGILFGSWLISDEKLDVSVQIEGKNNEVYVKEKR